MLNIKKLQNLLLGLMFLGFVMTAHSKITVPLDQFRVVGEANLKFLIFNIYDARLLVDDRTYNNDSEVRPDWKLKRSIALEIIYNMNFSGDKVVESTISEIEKQNDIDQATIEQWQAMIKPIFPNIKSGDKIIAHFDKDGKTEFSWNDQYIGKVSDVRFSEAFFDIWLSANTSDPDFTDQLFGQ